MDCNPAAAVDFLRHVSPDGPWQLALKGDGGESLKRLYSFSDPARVATWIREKQLDSNNVYFLLNPAAPGVRTTPTKPPKANQLACLAGLHSDIDVKEEYSPEKVADLVKRMGDFDPLPTVAVMTGGGVQPMWLFPERMPSTPENIERVEAVNLAIVNAVTAVGKGADHCWNANRWLRLPGTVNFPDSVKRARGRVPTLAYVIFADWERAWSFAKDPAPKLPHDLLSDAVDDPDDDIDPNLGHVIAALKRPLQHAIITGDAAKYNNDRSKLVIYIACSLVRLDWDDDEICAVLLDPRHGVSAHVRDQSNPQSYARRQCARARKLVGELWNRDGEGRVLHNDAGNLRRGFAKLNYRFDADVFAGRMYYVNGTVPRAQVNDDMVNTLYYRFEERLGLRPSRIYFQNFVSYLAHENEHHPVRDFLDGLPPWDGVVRIGSPESPSWLSIYGGAEDTLYTRAVGRLVIVAACRRVRQPGAKFDEMLVLVSPKQGTDKSSAIGILAVRDEWFTDSISMNAKGREMIEQLEGKLFVEFAELKGMRDSRVEHVKNLLSQRADRGRAAYAHFQSEVNRQCVFIGTTNEFTFLSDVENRRYWPVVIKIFDIPALKRDLIQIWAEANEAERAGESIRLDPQLWPLAAEHQSEHRQEEPWAGLLAEYLTDLRGRITSDDAWKIINKPGHMRNQSDSARLGEALRELGFDRETQRINGRAAKCYVRGATAADRRLTVYVFRDPVTGSVSAGNDPIGPDDIEDRDAPRRGRNNCGASDDDIPF